MTFDLQSTNTRNWDGYQVGDRVQLHPSTDRWMMGDRYGTVEILGENGIYVHVRMDKSKVLQKISVDLVIPI